MPAMSTVEIAVDEHGERISFVPEDDIEGGRLHVMYDRLRHDDYAGALLVAESILFREPGHHDAVQCREMCHSELRKLYVSRLVSLDRVPQIAMDEGTLAVHVQDARAIASPLGTIVERSGMVELEALGLLSALFLRHVIEFEDE
jgi:hypothetical protein